MIRALGTTGVALALAASLAACGKTKTPDAAAPPTAAPAKAAALDTEPPARPKIVALGDSITAGLGVFQVEAYPALLQSMIDADGYDFEVVNAGESGDTSATALRRLDFVLDPATRILIVALGGNDALRGISPATTHDNVLAIVTKAQAKGIDVLLAGMEAPPNLGEDYTSAFRAVFSKIARESNAVFLPFLLDGVAGKPELNQDDGIHPTAAGHRIIAAAMYDRLKPMLDDLVNK